MSIFLKKYLICLTALLPLFSYATTAPYDFQSNNNGWNLGTTTSAETNTSKIADKQILQDQTSPLNQIIAYFNLTPFKFSDAGVRYVRTVINYALALVALIATVSLMLGFYRMFMSDNGTEAFARALKLVKGSIIAILLLGFSWVIISFLLNVFLKISNVNTVQGTTTSTGSTTTN